MYVSRRLALPTLFAGLALLIIGIEVWVVHSAAFMRQPGWVSLGVTADLAVGLPLLYYFLIVRQLKVPVRTLVGVFGLALGLTTLILPTNQQQLAGLVGRLLVVVELGFVSYVLVRVRRIVQHYRQLSRLNPDFIENLKQSLDIALGRSHFNRILVSELAVQRYGLFGWLVPTEKGNNDTAFTTHRTSGQPALTVGLIAIGLIETVVLHLLASRWGPLAAWSLTVVGLYGLLFFVADLFAVIKRPLLLRANQLVLRFGLRGHGYVDRDQIEAVTVIRDMEKGADLFVGTFMSAPNLLLTFRKPVTITRPLGIQKSVRRVTLFVDDKETFIQQLTAA